MRRHHSAFASNDQQSVPLHVVTKDTLSDWLDGQPERVRAWLSSVGFQGNSGETICVPDASGGLDLAVFGMGRAAARARGRFALGTARQKLPAGTYHLAGGIPDADLPEQALAWLLAGYSFDRFRHRPAEELSLPALKAPAGIDAHRIETLASAEWLTRDLINTPASQLGPEELETTVLTLADDFNAQVSVTYGDDLLVENFPLIHAVGRASDRMPRLLDLRWGDEGPSLTLVGKGVCFDTGGLNIKPGASMGLMKKDMGGAATVLGLAMMIMALGWKVRLRVLIPAVENSISGSAMRPGDVLTARNGRTVEVNNTDAEGRLVLADALALACEEAPDALICMATLTGAARVALGPDLPPFYTDDEPLADALARAARSEADPLWRMPFHAPYESLIEPGIADLDNAPSGGMAGSITAALFLRRFAEGAQRFAHFDIYGWQPVAAPARPKGGVGQGARALLRALPEVLGPGIDPTARNADAP
ncbi:leucyl aminopeptidase family protein [Rhodobacter sp. NTK016B]|uniref:leucyl aminopeptidase family protein n=1 Tax=Rhodobacter sp. NTK016B TaxID=2759676 RepID=UPI001A8DBCD0|nr:leucyl aminopeptidase family protein [Rhodobacter sp. NTK016B]MBN8292991.1 leucyl aminopeptidase family protein [Rhodobacter sp. NTK016B]